MKLSLCIAAHNEETTIHIPLDSAYDFVDEVVLVDGASDDRTVEVAKRYGKKVRIIPASNESMFHINKQKAIEQAKGDWILQLDADEAVSPELREEIQKIITNDELRKTNVQNNNGKIRNKNSPHVFAYWIPRKNWFLSRFLTKGGIYPDETIRLYRRGAARFPCKTVHENVEVEGVVGHLKTPILHYADPTFERYLKRWHRYNELDARLLIEKGERPCFVCSFFGKPIATFFNIYICHKGFMDGVPGLIWAFFSAIRYAAIYFKWWQKQSA